MAAPETENEYQDERYKSLDPRMVEIIESEIIER